MAALSCVKTAGILSSASGLILASGSAEGGAQRFCFWRLIFVHHIVSSLTPSWIGLFRCRYSAAECRGTVGSLVSTNTLEPGVFRVVFLLVREAAAAAGDRAAVQEAQADLPLLVLQCNAEPVKSRKRGTL